MTLADLSVSLRGCPRRWIATALLVAISILACARASALRGEREALDAARLERIEDARKIALENVELRSLAETRRAWDARLSAAAAPSSADAIQRLRGRLDASGLAIEGLEARGATAGAAIALVDVHLAAHGGYRALRGLLADLESSGDGWTALSYDGARLDAEVLVPARAEATPK